MEIITGIVGVDEAGRGAWAGPVYAAAVILDANAPIQGLADSKLLSPKQRDNLFECITSQALAYGIASATVEEIDNMNILQASLLAMKRAVALLTIPFHEVWVDGNQSPDWDYQTRCIIDGDNLVDDISAASILAKVSRDRVMQAYDDMFPYGFAAHKGYGTALHQQRLQLHGVSLIHRRSFKPIKARLVEEAHV
jgi:ribonuclease HII